MPQPTDITTGISDAEWEVIKALWASGPATAGEVVSAVSSARRGANAWRPRTIKTLLARLVKKGRVRREVRSDGTHLYRAAVTREAAARRESESFLARVFDGALVPAVATMIRTADLTPDDLRQLRQILEREARGAKR